VTLLTLSPTTRQPLALQYGKRPIYLLSILCTMATQIWAPHARTNGQWIASKIVQGFVGSPIESLCEISVTDIYFTHERGRYIGLYALLLAGSNYFAPIISGFIADAMGWQWVLVSRKMQNENRPYGRKSGLMICSIGPLYSAV
jgi:MFS family permease